VLLERERGDDGGRAHSASTRQPHDHKPTGRRLARASVPLQKRLKHLAQVFDQRIHPAAETHSAIRAESIERARGASRLSWSPP
jgi:hypothetical protein